MCFIVVELLGVVAIDHFRIRKLHGFSTHLEYGNFRSPTEFSGNSLFYHSGGGTTSRIPGLNIGVGFMLGGDTCEKEDLNGW